MFNPLLQLLPYPPAETKISGLYTFMSELTRQVHNGNNGQTDNDDHTADKSCGRWRCCIR